MVSEAVPVGSRPCLCGRGHSTPSRLHLFFMETPFLWRHRPDLAIVVDLAIYTLPRHLHAGDSQQNDIGKLLMT